MAAILHIKPKKELLDLKFEGYKLSLDSIPVLKQPIQGGVEAFELNSEDYSFLQVRMTTLVNQLFQDMWSPQCVFFISEKQYVYWSCLQEDGRLADPRVVWQLPVDHGHPGSNAAISFPGMDWAVISSGTGEMFLLNTPSRAAGEPWLVCHTYSAQNRKSPCYLLHSLHRCFPSGQQIDCLTAHVCHPDSEENLKMPDSVSPAFVCILQWTSFSCGQNIQSWTMKRFRKYVGTSTPEYAAIEPSGTALCLASESEFKIFCDSDKPVQQIEVENKDMEPPLYTYIQTPEDITVVFRLSDEIAKSDVQVVFKPSHIEVLLHGKPVLKGNLSNTIDTSSSTWIIDGEKLELTLSKAEVGLMWQELVKGDKRGTEIADPALVAEIHNKLAHLTSETEVAPSDSMPFNLQQLEECDCCTDLFALVRIDGDSHAETHKVIMSGHQRLFSKQLCPEQLPIICLRHDVDGIIWQPRNSSSEGELDHFKIEHVATFSALGYVQASKQDKKFISCSPDFRFCAVTDFFRHVYIYRQPEHIHSALELRNRKTGESVSHIAKQYVVCLEDCDRMLGFQVTKECIFVLSKKILYAVKMVHI